MKVQGEKVFLSDAFLETCWGVPGEGSGFFLKVKEDAGIKKNGGKVGNRNT